ncbi:permease-like cell division protein FtsX [Candidatus Igneacidithiobacillus taiwanensis]|uniref:permease-like cell division protein FtsX n=1 Tax=Candidatus Igneacidithiobacillus taiwanensis TaxID=1945924 RepID=UPI0028A1B65A|nr:permease-like cell division protein FtsX [Candidatus Igneacidithiobacillus taiwanensis]
MSIHIRLQALRNARNTLLRQPIATLLTIIALAVVFALPVGLFTALSNMQRLLASWHDQAQISLYLHSDASPQAIAQLRTQLRQSPGVVAVRYVDKQQALTDFQRYAGMTAAIQTLGENPLPASLIVELDPLAQSPAQLEQQLQQWSHSAIVSSAQSDLKWVARLQAIVALGTRAVYILAILLALGAVLVMGNTIRLHIEQRREEIEISSLVGATRSFIRRPFLYQGLIQGILAGFLAWLIVAVAFAVLQGPVNHLASLYGTQFPLHALSPLEGFLLVLISAALGWLGSLLAVGRHLDNTVS